MKYPKIPGLEGHKPGPCVVFEKLDGTNLCFDWSRDLSLCGSGFWRQTTRSLREFDVTDPDFGSAIPLFLEKYAKLDEIFIRDYKEFKDIRVFVEFLGPSSFAGIHTEEPKDVVMFDIMLCDKMMSPFEFVEKFKHLGIPRVLANGRLPPKLIEQVKAGSLVNEGVVIKGENWMCKVKSKLWLEKLKTSKIGHKGHWTDAAGIKRTLKEEFES